MALEDIDKFVERWGLEIASDPFIYDPERHRFALVANPILGDLIDGSKLSPWHGSLFRLHDWIDEYRETLEGIFMKALEDNDLTYDQYLEKIGR